MTLYYDYESWAFMMLWPVFHNVSVKIRHVYAHQKLLWRLLCFASLFPRNYVWYFPKDFSSSSSENVKVSWLLWNHHHPSFNEKGSSQKGPPMENPIFFFELGNNFLVKICTKYPFSKRAILHFGALCNFLSIKWIWMKMSNCNFLMFWRQNLTLCSKIQILEALFARKPASKIEFWNSPSSVYEMQNSVWT